MKIQELFEMFPKWRDKYTQLRITNGYGRTLSAYAGTFEKICTLYAWWPVASWDFDEDTLNIEVVQR